MSSPEEKKSSEYDRISPTAYSLAYRRTFSDIPYCREIYDAMEQMRLANGDPDLPDEWKTTGIAPQFEARYKLVNRFLQEQNADQILEIAAGFSPRGLAMTENPDVSFVEVDLPSVMAQKVRILNSIRDADSRRNLHLESGDAFDSEALQGFAAAHFDPRKPIAVVNEGLMRYLNFDQKATYAKNVGALLRRFGGVWVTPDMTLKAMLAREDVVARGNNERIKTTTGINIDENSFENVDQAKKFFEDQGFSVEPHTFLEVVDVLVSPTRLHLSATEVQQTLQDCFVFVMRLKSDLNL